MRAFEEKIVNATKGLIKLKGSTTTLDVKNFLRGTFPDEMWNQDGVSKTLMRLSEQEGLAYKDNGIYRTYYSQPVVIYLSKSDMVQVLKDNPDEVFEIKWIKNSGKKGYVEGTIDLDDFMSNMGYIMVRSTIDNKLRSVNPATLQQIKIGRITYSAK